VNGRTAGEGLARRSRFAKYTRSVHICTQRRSERSKTKRFTVARLGRVREENAVNGRIYIYIYYTVIRVSRKNSSGRYRLGARHHIYIYIHIHTQSERERVSSRRWKRRFYDAEDGENVTCVAKARTAPLAVVYAALTECTTRAHAFAPSGRLFRVEYFRAIGTKKKKR